MAEVSAFRRFLRWLDRRLPAYRGQERDLTGWVQMPTPFEHYNVRCSIRELPDSLRARHIAQLETARAYRAGGHDPVDELAGLFDGVIDADVWNEIMEQPY